MNTYYDPDTGEHVPSYLWHLCQRGTYAKIAADRDKLVGLIESCPQHAQLARAKELLSDLSSMLAAWEIDKHLPFGESYGQPN